MAQSNPSLYRWKRLTAPKPSTTTSKKVTNNDDIQDWIKKVQEASDRAAAVTFGHRYTGGSHGNSMSTAMATVDALHDHDEAYTEAQDLLNQWMSDKCILDDDAEEEYDYDSPSPRRQPPTKSEVKKHWDNLLEVEDPGFAYPYTGVSSDAVAREIEERDDDAFVDNILQGLMDKPVIEEDFYQDLGLDDSKKKKGRDPTVSMHVRHQKVKENRERRTKEREKQLREKQRQKDAHYQAQQIVLKEERDKALKNKKEDSLIQQEMTKIRKEMEEQRQLTEEAKRRERESKEAEREKMRLKRERQQMDMEMKRIQSQRMAEKEHTEMKIRLEELKAQKAAEDIKSLQRHFSAWYKLIVNRRLQMGKARALGDWRCLVRSWNGWRAYVRHKQMKREERETHLYLQQSHRNNILSVEHYRHNVLKKCFSAWQLFVLQERQDRELTERKHETRNKMDAFLAAAASGKLWSNRGDGDKLVVDDVETNNSASDRPDSTRRKLDALFDQPVRKPQSHSIPSTSRSDLSIPDSHPRRPETLEKPKFAWQVTRKHINLTKEQLGNHGDAEQNNAPSSITQENIEKDLHDNRRGRKPIPYTVNNFEHRYAAQQKILQDQQDQLKEQQRLIVELQAGQRQQSLQQELNNLQGVSTVEKPSKINNKCNEINPPISARSQSDTALSTRSDNSGSSSSTSNNTKKKIKSETNFVKSMEERAARIAQRKTEAERRKRQREDEKLARIREEEAKRLAEEEEERKTKLERIREERRLAKQRELEKQQRLEYINRQNNKADEHYRQTLLRNKGIKPWIKLINISKQNMQVAVDHCNTQLLCRCFMPWKDIAQEIVREKEMMADELYKYILARRAFSSWRKYGHLQSIQLQKARRHFAYTATVKYFKLWQDFVTEERVEFMRKDEMAMDHSEYRIMKTAFITWREYPKTIKLLREKEKRRSEMRKKVQSLLPDFGS